jgi:hypothetical protein
MRTEELIGRLAAEGAAPAGPGPAALSRLTIYAACGGLLAALALLASQWGVRPDLGAALLNAPVLLKFGLSAALGLGGLIVALRSAVPGRRLDPGRAVAPLVAVAFASAVLWPETRLSDWAPPFDRDALFCAGSIVLLALPPFALFATAMRRGAPTAPRLAGAAAGLAAGGIGGVAYGFYCPIDAPGYVAVWYPAGAFVAAGFGALLGRRFLSW